jgi:hypothetical protein
VRGLRAREPLPLGFREDLAPACAQGADGEVEALPPAAGESPGGAAAEQGEGEATAKFRALVTGGESWIPENGQLFEFDTG